MPDEPNSQDDAVQGTAESEWERMLSDAYDVPAVPRSLLKRLDRAAGREWGFPSGVARHRPSPSSRLAAMGSRALKVWPVAASIVLILGTVAVFQNYAHAYGWPQLLDALAGAALVQIEEEGGRRVRWMSMERAIVGEQSANRSRLFDFGRGVMLERSGSEQQIVRREFGPAKSLSQREAIAVAFLLNDFHEDDHKVRQSTLQISCESWAAKGDEVVLNVDFVSQEKTTKLSITIDPETHLPKNVACTGADAPSGAVAVSYPSGDAAQLGQYFSPNLPTIDVRPAPDALAADDRASRGDIPKKEVNSQVSESGSAPFGAASLAWRPVFPDNNGTKSTAGDPVERINGLLNSLWSENGVIPASSASDEELLRRVYLDLAGRTPSVSEAREYLADESPDRYVHLVDRLLDSRDHATHLATVWRTYLIPEGLDLTRFGGTESFEKWIGEQFIEGVPYDEIVRRLLLAEGRLTQSGPLLFYAAVKLDPDQLATRSSRVFLGMRLDCAQCHDDHFEPWLQEDFWGYAAFFAQISRPRGVLNNVSTVMRVRDLDRGEVRLPESDIVVSPRFLDGAPLANKAGRRQQLADWLTADENPFFARATANRVWGQLFGKGIVDPVDGFGTQHEPVSQELLDHVAGHFITSGYDLRELFRMVVLSQAYRLSSGSATPDSRRQRVFAQMNVKLLTAEQMYDCMTVASMLQSAESGTGFNLLRVDNAGRAQFLQQFRAPPGRATEYQAGIPQALTLMNGELISNATDLASSGLLKTLEVPFISNRDRVEILYLATLSRRPSESEQELLSDYIREETAGDELYESLADVLWALLNSAEFTMNH